MRIDGREQASGVLERNKRKKERERKRERRREREGEEMIDPRTHLAKGTELIRGIGGRDLVDRAAVDRDER